MQIALMLATADKDGDHMITFPEWMQLMRHDAEKAARAQEVPRRGWGRC